MDLTVFETTLRDLLLCRLQAQDEAARGGGSALETSTLDIYRTANLLIHQYGSDEAPLIAAKRADALLGLGDLDGQRIWKSILQAIEELLRAEPRAGEHMN